MGAPKKDGDKSVELLISELDKIIESKKKENKSLKAIVDVMAKNKEEEEKEEEK